MHDFAKMAEWLNTPHPASEDLGIPKPDVILQRLNEAKQLVFGLEQLLLFSKKVHSPSTIPIDVSFEDFLKSLPRRVHSAIEQLNVTGFADLCTLTATQIWEQRGVGMTSICDLVDGLKELGYTLHTDADDRIGKDLQRDEERRTRQ